MKRWIALAAAGTLCLSGCGARREAAQPNEEQPAPVSPQVQALERAEQAGMLQSDRLDDDEVLDLVLEPLDDTQYTAEVTDEVLEVAGADGDNAHPFCVVEVRGADGAAVGQIAVDRVTGEKYTYRGDGALDDYASFPLYDAEAERGDRWSGSYRTAAGRTVELTDQTDTTFDFVFYDGTAGCAVYSERTAKSEDGKINFLLSDGVLTVAGGDLTGNYKAVPAESEG